MKLSKLRSRRAKRVKKRQRHYRKYVSFRGAGKDNRARWQLKRFRWQKKAIRKLDKIIAAEKARILEQHRIDWNGYPRLTHPPLLKAVRAALTVNGLYVTSTNGGTHSPSSWHYRDRAVDFGSSGPGEGPEIAAQRLLLDKFGASYFAELFGPDPWYVKNGVVYTGVFPAHGDHLHIAVA